MLTGAARGLALFLGAFTIVNLIGESRVAAADLNLWWIDFWPLPAVVEKVLLALLALALLLFAFRPRRHPLSIAVLGAAIVASAVNAAQYYQLLARGTIKTSIPLPFSLLVLFGLTLVLVAMLRRQPTDKRMFALVTVGAIGLFPLAQIALFGATDYRRPADLIVVFGARVYADGTTSAALKDRVREATVRNTAALVAGRPTRILAVSDFFHLPRIKMAFRRHGLEVYTIPARTSVPEQMPYNLFRETAAFWVYYARYVIPSEVEGPRHS